MQNKKMKKAAFAFAMTALVAAATGTLGLTMARAEQKEVTKEVKETTKAAEKESDLTLIKEEKDSEGKTMYYQDKDKNEIVLYIYDDGDTVIKDGTLTDEDAELIDGECQYKNGERGLCFSIKKYNEGKTEVKYEIVNEKDEVDNVEVPAEETTTSTKK